MANFEEVGKAFVNHYFNMFDSNQRANLRGLYQPQSMLTFEDGKFQGADAIVNKLTSLSFQQVRHEVTTLEAQPTTGGGVLILVCGQLVVDGESNALKFSQVFNLLPANGNFFVANELFRFV
ncbi:nuclear transport factor 2 [Planoprotostelium fungivorum]|uniref:Nuclear transport factor 2 n=1 Tax=Planoprotostelium fungivorum TaxID=1890364 RepID=A0A2P6MQZ1_9EUKA|nr:nuclear transport factor 2 [Planoprotostelium fungivorum]